MQPAGIFEKMMADSVEGVLEFADGPADPSILVEPAALPAVLEYLKGDGELLFDQLSLVSGVHYDDRFECVYHLLSTILKHDVILKVKLDVEDPVVPTASGVHPTADWHERETYDLVGIRFEEHPDPRRIYLPEGWVGHPLRRDYEYPEEFQGIPLTDVKRAQWEPLEPSAGKTAEDAGGKTAEDAGGKAAEDAGSKASDDAGKDAGDKEGKE